MELKIVKSFKEPGSAFEVCLGPCFVLGSIQFLARVEAHVPINISLEKCHHSQASRYAYHKNTLHSGRNDKTS